MPKRKKFLQPPVQLNLGCNRRPLEGWINVDLEPFPGVNVVTDLESHWPWADDSVDLIRAYDLVEHLHQPIHTMNEAWRVLKPGGMFEILVPSSAGHGAFQDPTHVSFWNENSFHYYRVYKPEGEDKYVSHPYRRLYAPHLIRAAFEIELGVSDPSDDGVIYVLAKCTKREDPGDCEAPQFTDGTP